MSGWSRFLALHPLLGPSLCYLVLVPTTEVVVHHQVRCCSGENLVPRLCHDKAQAIVEKSWISFGEMHGKTVGKLTIGF